MENFKLDLGLLDEEKQDTNNELKTEIKMDGLFDLSNHHRTGELTHSDNSINKPTDIKNKFIIEDYRDRQRTQRIEQQIPVTSHIEKFNDYFSINKNDFKLNQNGNIEKYEIKNNKTGVELPTISKVQVQQNPIQKKVGSNVFSNLDDFEFDDKVKIKVFGVGGAGNNMVYHMYHNANILKEQLYAFNTDYQVLKKLPQELNKILIGKTITRGNGSGSDPLVGKQAAEEDKDLIESLLADTDVLFIVSGMGKGTGTGASPIIAEVARSLNILVISIVNLPSITTEGRSIYQKGYTGYQELKKLVHGITTIDNEKIISEDEITLQKSFEKANEIITSTIQSLIDVIEIPAEINVDFNDIKTFFNNPIRFQVSDFKFTDSTDIKNALLSQLNQSYLNHSLSGSDKAIANFRLNPEVKNTFVSEIRLILEDLTDNKNLNMTYSVDFDENIEFAEVSLIIDLANEIPTADESAETAAISTQSPDHEDFIITDHQTHQDQNSYEERPHTGFTDNLKMKDNEENDDNEFIKLKEQIEKRKESLKNNNNQILETKRVDFNNIEISSTKLNSVISKTLKLFNPTKTNKVKMLTDN